MGELSFYLFFPAWFVFTLWKFSESIPKFFQQLKHATLFWNNSIRFPFAWKNPFGYMVAFLAQCEGCIALATVYLHFVNLIFGSCWLFIIMAKDITKDIAAFNVAAKATNGNRMEISKRFCDMIQIHSDVKK